MCSWKHKIKMRNEKVYILRSMQGQEVVRLLFSLRTGSNGLLEDKMRGVQCVRVVEEKMWSIYW